MSEAAIPAHEDSLTKTSGVGLLVAAVGVVYGDIGTSPLYTLKEVFAGHYGVQANQDGVLGILSLICLLYTSPSPRDATLSRMPSSA